MWYTFMKKMYECSEVNRYDMINMCVGGKKSLLHAKKNFVMFSSILCIAIVHHFVRGNFVSQKIFLLTYTSATYIVNG